MLKELMSTQDISKIKQTKTALARKMGVSRGMLYYRHRRPLSDEALRQDIKKVMRVHKAYGHKRIAIELHANRKRILRVMNKFHLKPIKRRGKKCIKPLDMKKLETPFKNEIERICPIWTNVVWVGDFTHIRFQNTWVYLATVMDLYTREIIGWHLSTTHTKDLIMHAFQDALENRKTAPLYFHSDQGSEYESDQNIQLMKHNNIIVSMSRKSHPWENGYQESFYSQFKLELGETNQYQNLGELYETHAITLHYYNTKRIHTALKTSPLQFRLSREYLFNKLGT